MDMTTQKRLAYEMTMEYFKQNNLFAKPKSQIKEIVEEFAEVQKNFYDSMTNCPTRFIN